MREVSAWASARPQLCDVAATTRDSGGGGKPRTHEKHSRDVDARLRGHDDYHARMPSASLRSIYLTPRMSVLLAIGFSAGVPLMLTSRTMTIWARGEGIDLATIGLFSLVTLPYSLKVFWAPVIDRIVPPFLGRRRGWLLITQCLLIVAIAGMGLSGPNSSDSPLLLFALFATAVAFFSASQDIVADAYRTDVLEPREYGAGASVFTAGFRAAMLATGAGALLLATIVDWRFVYLSCAALMITGVVATIAAPSPPVDAPPATLASAVIDPVRDLATRHGVLLLLVLLFIVLFKVPDYMASAMNDPLLIDIGFTKEEIAFWGLGVGTAVTIPGVLLGGLIASTIGLGRALVIFGVAQAMSNAGYLALAGVGANVPIMIGVISVEYFCSGLVAAGFVAFLMSLCNHRFTATQYALLTSVMGLSNAFAKAPTGYIVEETSYPTFFAITIVAAVPGMLLLVPLLPHLKRVERGPASASPSA